MNDFDKYIKGKNQEAERIPVTSMRLPRDIKEWLEDLVDRGLFTSKTEAIRYFLRAGKDFYPYGK